MDILNKCIGVMKKEDLKTQSTYIYNVLISAMDIRNCPNMEVQNYSLLYFTNLRVHNNFIIILSIVKFRNIDYL